MVSAMYVFLGPRDIIGGGLHVGTAIECDIGVTVGPTPGVYLGLPAIGYTPVEGNRDGSDVEADKYNPVG